MLPSSDNKSDLPGTLEVDVADRPLRIAVVYSRIPFPMMRGDQLTVSNLLNFLSTRGHSADLLTLALDGELTDEQDRWLSGTCRRVDFFKHSKATILFGILRNLIKLKPLQIGYFDNRELTKTLRSRIDAGEYDIVYTYYIRSTSSTPPYFAANKCTDINDTRVAAFLALQLSQTLNTKRIYENASQATKRLLYYIEWKLMQRFEASTWKNYTRSVLIGPADVKEIVDACKLTGKPEINNWLYGAHGTNVKLFQPATESERIDGKIVFSGSMNYQPNVQAISWFVNHCWDQIKANVSNASLSIVGRDPPPEVLAFEKLADVEVTGTVPDVSTHIRSATVAINPVQAAGGMQNKLIEYMASAKAIVATAVANEGIRATDDEHLLIRDSEASFTEAVIDLLQNDTKRDNLGISARNFVLENWTWESHFLKLENDFYEALDQCETQLSEKD